MPSCECVKSSSEYSAAHNAMGVRHDLERLCCGLRCYGHRTWPSGYSAECKALGLTVDPGVMLTVFSGLGT